MECNREHRMKNLHRLNELLALLGLSWSLGDHQKSIWDPCLLIVRALFHLPCLPPCIRTTHLRGSSCPVGLSKPLRSVLSNSCSAFVIQHHWHFDDVASLDWLRPIVCSAMAFLFIYEYIIVIKFALMSFNCILSFKGLFGDEDGWGEGFFGMWFIWIKYKSNIFYIWILYMKIL